MLANLGCSQSHLGQQPVSICMHVPVSSSIWVNGLQYGRAPVTTAAANVQRINRSNDNVIASVCGPSRLYRIIPLAILFFCWHQKRRVYSHLENVAFAYNDIILCCNDTNVLSVGSFPTQLQCY